MVPRNGDRYAGCLATSSGKYDIEVPAEPVELHVPAEPLQDDEPVFPHRNRVIGFWQRLKDFLCLGIPFQAAKHSQPQGNAIIPLRPNIGASQGSPMQKKLA
jgi:hypothetical protein